MEQKQDCRSGTVQELARRDQIMQQNEQIQKVFSKALAADPPRSDGEPQEIDDLMQKTEEFDSDFFVGNPGIVKAQRYFKRNYEDIIGDMRIDFEAHPDIPMPDRLVINLTNNNQSMNFNYGLNQNRRGKLLQTDLESLQHEEGDEETNFKFGQRPSHVVEEHRKKLDKTNKQLELNMEQNQKKVLEAIKQINEKSHAVMNQKLDLLKKIEEEIEKEHQKIVQAQEEKEQFLLGQQRDQQKQPSLYLPPRNNSNLGKPSSSNISARDYISFNQQPNGSYFSNQQAVQVNSVHSLIRFEENKVISHKESSRNVTSRSSIFNNHISIEDSSGEHDFEQIPEMKNRPKMSQIKEEDHEFPGIVQRRQNSQKFKEIQMPIDIQKQSQPSSQINFNQRKKEEDEIRDNQKTHMLQKIHYIVSGPCGSKQNINSQMKSEQEVVIKMLNQRQIQFNEQKVVQLTPKKIEYLLNLLQVYDQEDYSDCQSQLSSLMPQNCPPNIYRKNFSDQELLFQQIEQQRNQSMKYHVSNTSSVNSREPFANRAKKRSFNGCSDHSGSQQSHIRKNKMQGLEMEYQDYIASQQGIFVLRCQMMNKEYSKIIDRINLEERMRNQKGFITHQNNLMRDELLKNVKTLVIDIENTLVTKIDIKNLLELNQLTCLENFKDDYVVVNMKSYRRQDSQKCCDFEGSEQCICDILVYMVRPYAYDLLRAVQPFFELICYSKNHSVILEQIVDHIEEVINRPVKEWLEKHRNNSPNRSSKQRMKNMPQIKVYFSYIIHQKQYLNIEEYGIQIENFLVLTKNRTKNQLIFISSNPLSIVAAINQGYQTIPVVQFESFCRDDFQLNLVENYILKLRHLEEMKLRLTSDFSMMIHRKNSIMSSRVLNSQVRQYSSNSFGGGGGSSLSRRSYLSGYEVPSKDYSLPRNKVPDAFKFYNEEIKNPEIFYVESEEKKKELEKSPDEIPDILQSEEDSICRRNIKKVCKENNNLPLDVNGRVLYDANCVILEEGVESQSKSGQSSLSRINQSQDPQSSGEIEQKGQKSFRLRSKSSVNSEERM